MQFMSAIKNWPASARRPRFRPIVLAALAVNAADTLGRNQVGQFIWDSQAATGTYSFSLTNP